MIETSLFANQEREVKLNKSDEVLGMMALHVAFAALAGVAFAGLAQIGASNQPG